MGNFFLNLLETKIEGGAVTKRVLEPFIGIERASGKW